MNLHLLLLSLPLLHTFAAVVNPYGRTVLETWITTVVVPAGHTQSRAWGELASLLEGVVDHANRIGTSYDDVEKRQRDTPTSTVASTSSTTNTKSSAEIPKPENCFVTPSSCNSGFLWIRGAFNKAGPFTDPNDKTIDLKFQETFCSYVGKENGGKFLQECESCLTLTGQWATVGAFAALLEDFCKAKPSSSVAPSASASSAPSMFLLLAGKHGILQFLRDMHAPNNFINTDISGITMLASKYTQGGELMDFNVPTSTTWSSSKNSSGPTKFSSSTDPSGSNNPHSTPAAPLPTELLTQLPRNWPYSEYAVNQKGKTATWTLTKPGNGSIPVALAEAPLQWYPRPLSSHQDLLAGYTHKVAESAGTTNAPREF